MPAVQLGGASRLAILVARSEDLQPNAGRPVQDRLRLVAETLPDSERLAWRAHLSRDLEELSYISDELRRAGRNDLLGGVHAKRGYLIVKNLEASEFDTKDAR